MNEPKPGWVSVAAAAAALTAAGDPIDASNVSRYLQRFPEIPQEKPGKFRFVELEALKRHRATNVRVDEKRGAREDAHAVREPDPEPSAISSANLRLKELQIEERELDLAERAGKLVPHDQVLMVVNGVTATLIAELERQETLIASMFGREVAAEVRKARKLAQSKASVTLVELARKHLPGQLAEASAA